MRQQQLLSIYLNDHLTAANAGVELFRRVRRSQAGSDYGDELAALTREDEADRAALIELVRRLGVRPNLAWNLLGGVAEKVGRLKPNGRIVRRSPLSDILELEGLRVAVLAKKHGWEVLRAVAAHDDRVTRLETEQLIDRAEDQADRLGKLHLRVTQDVLAAAD